MAARHMGHRPEEEIMSRLRDRIRLGSLMTVSSFGLGIVAQPVQVH
jgi:hypothetical protein